MYGDRYSISDQDLLGELIIDLNAHLPANRQIQRWEYIFGEAKLKVVEAVASKLQYRVTHEDRWNCFKYALSIRSLDVCRKILRTKSFDFTEHEREWLEWSARH